MKKVMAAMMMMAITCTVPAMAGNKPGNTSHHHNNGKHGKTVVVVDKKVNHPDAHRHAYRPDVKACTFKVSRHDSHRKAIERVEHMRGVMNTKWNPRTRELTVVYDAKMTSALHIRHLIA